MEGLWHKETDCTTFAKKFLQIFCKQPVKWNLHIFSFSWLKMAWSRAFQKCIIYFFLNNFFFANIFTIKLDFAKKVQFLQICNFFSDSKSRAQELSNDVWFVIFGHQTWDLEGGGAKLTPPPAYPGFQVPQQG